VHLILLRHTKFDVEDHLNSPLAPSRYKINSRGKAARGQINVNEKKNSKKGRGQKIFMCVWDGEEPIHEQGEGRTVVRRKQGRTC
jgi:hypothetical protein